MIELTCCDDVIIREAAMPEVTRDHIAQTYAMALVSSWKTDWKKVNEAILARWPKGLNYIKTQAWRIVKDHQREATRRISEGN